LGTNEAGGEFGDAVLPGIYNEHYIYPNINAIEASIEQGMNVFRMGLRWERFQHELFGDLTEFDLTEYKKIVDATTAKGAVLIIDPHNYARYNNNVIGSEEVPIEAFADFWAKLAEVFKDNEKVWFDLVNEPHDMETDDWFKAARAAVDAIRATGAKNNILISGNGWDGAWSWGKEAWYGESNADVALRYFSSEDENIIFEVHQYFDSDYSGTHDTCVQRPCQNLLKEFVEWLKTNNLKGWLGETSSTLSEGCKECVQEVLEYLEENREHVLGVTWWAAGPWWGHTACAIEPNEEKAFPEQMAWLKPYL
ncbi:cellulase, partial [Neocallimastix californiae]